MSQTKKNLAKIWKFCLIVEWAQFWPLGLKQVLQKRYWNLIALKCWHLSSTRPSVPHKGHSFSACEIRQNSRICVELTALCWTDGYVTYRMCGSDGFRGRKGVHFRSDLFVEETYRTYGCVDLRVPPKIKEFRNFPTLLFIEKFTVARIWPLKIFELFQYSRKLKKIRQRSKSSQKVLINTVKSSTLSILQNLKTYQITIFSVLVLKMF